MLLILQWQQEGDAAELVAWLGCQCMGTNVLTWHFHAHIFFETLMDLFTPTVLQLV